MISRFFGFTKDRRGFFISSRTWKLKLVPGRKPHELGQKLSEITEKSRTAATLEEQVAFLEEQDKWCASVLETYRENFDYDVEVENYDLAVLRHATTKLFTTLSVVGTDPRMHQIMKNDAHKINIIPENEKETN